MCLIETFSFSRFAWHHTSGWSGMLSFTARWSGSQVLCVKLQRMEGFWTVWLGWKPWLLTWPSLTSFRHREEGASFQQDEDGSLGSPRNLCWQGWGWGLLFLRHLTAAAAAKSLQSCPTLCDPIDGSPPGSPVPGILQTRTLEWVAISFSNAGKWKVKVKSLSYVRLFATLGPLLSTSSQSY